MPRIVTYISATSPYSGEVQAMTYEEFQKVGDADFDEWVWHEAQDMEEAIRLHDEAFEAWQKTGNAYYKHPEPETDWIP